MAVQAEVRLENQIHKIEANSLLTRAETETVDRLGAVVLSGYKLAMVRRSMRG